MLSSFFWERAVGNRVKRARSRAFVVVVGHSGRSPAAAAATDAGAAAIATLADRVGR
jgi:hypothetical protein